MHQSELGNNKIDTQAKLECFILFGTTICTYSTIKRHMRIRSRTTKK